METTKDKYNALREAYIHAKGAKKKEEIFAQVTALIAEHPDEVFDTRGLLDHLKQRVARDAGTLDPEAVSRQLNACVTRIKGQK